MNEMNLIGMDNKSLTGSLRNPAKPTANDSENGANIGKDEKENPAPTPTPPSDSFLPSVNTVTYGAALVNSSAVGLNSYVPQLAKSVMPPTPPSTATTPATGGAATTAPADSTPSLFSKIIGPDSVMSKMVPWMAGIATTLLLYKGGKELYAGIKNKNDKDIINGSIDMLICATTATTAFPQMAGFGALASAMLLTVKIVTDKLP